MDTSIVNVPISTIFVRMAGNKIGKALTLTTFGESHGEAIGGVIDGFPAGVKIDMAFIQSELDRRKPGQSSIVTQRSEQDQVNILSGVFDGISTGTSIGFIIKNENQKTKDYEHIKDVFRPSHADYTYQQKYKHRDYRGGGRSSARETACRVVGGAFAKLILKKHAIFFSAYVSQVGGLILSNTPTWYEQSIVESNPVRCPDKKMAVNMEELIKKVRKEGDTIGGVVSCCIKGVPVGLGEPVFDKLQADLAKAMLSINAAKGFEYGSGFAGVNLRGSVHNDRMNVQNDEVIFAQNLSGGIQGGISNGEMIYFRVAFKPVATIMQSQTTVNTKGEQVATEGKGRHDPCVVPRAVVIVEAMAALTIADHLLRNNITSI
jgi:chorismate synthase